MDEVKRLRFRLTVWAWLSAGVVALGVWGIYTELSRRERYLPALGYTIEGARPEEVFIGVLVVVLGGLSLWRAMVALKRD